MLADFAGLTKTTIRRYERGERSASVKNLQAIAEALDCSIEDFLK